VLQGIKPEFVYSKQVQHSTLKYYFKLECCNCLL